jgi:hypothetical protein
MTFRSLHFERSAYTSSTTRALCTGFEYNHQNDEDHEDSQ